jgi:hypothetical protein
VVSAGTKLTSREFETTEDAAKAATLLAAARWIREHDGRESAVVDILGDAYAIDEAWKHQDLEGFRRYLWQRCRRVRRGAA